MNLTDVKIGDSKMDSGCLEEGEDLEDEYDFEKPLSPTQVFSIMVCLIYREASSTSFISLFINSQSR
jgi:hypothetical protein